MKKFVSMLVVLVVLISCMVTSTMTVSATGSEDYVWVVRELEVDEDFFTADEVKLNFKLWWQWNGDLIVPYTLKVKNVQIYVDGVLTEDWNHTNGLNLGRDDITDPEPTRTNEEGVVVEEGASKGEDYQLNMWSNGTTPVKKGNHVIQIRVYASVYSDDDWYSADTVRFCLWNEEGGNPFKETFQATEGEGTPIDMDEWETGTESYNEPKETPTADPDATPEVTEEATPEVTTAAPTTAAPTATQKATVAPTATAANTQDADNGDNTGFIIAIVVIAVVVVGVVVFFVVKKKK